MISLSCVDLQISRMWARVQYDRWNAEAAEAAAAEEKEKELSKQEKDVWTKPQEKEDEKTREDEFDDFLDDLFL